MSCDLIIPFGQVLLVGPPFQLLAFGLPLLGRQSQAGVEAEDGRFRNISFGKEAVAGLGKSFRESDLDVFVVENISCT